MRRDERYVPDLKGFIGNCETNYLRFLRLIPSIDEQSSWNFGIETSTDELSRVSITVIERSKYTVTLRLAQESEIADWMPHPTITVRLYHDAHMAEVLSFQKNRYVRQRYEYPNQKMFMPDEKAQLNKFLGEWLDHCKRVGIAPEMPQFLSQMP